MKKRRWRWTGRIMRMTDQSLAQTILKWTPQNKNMALKEKAYNRENAGKQKIGVEDSKEYNK